MVLAQRQIDADPVSLVYRLHSINSEPDTVIATGRHANIVSVFNSPLSHELLALLYDKISVDIFDSKGVLITRYHLGEVVRRSELKSKVRPSEIRRAAKCFDINSTNYFVLSRNGQIFSFKAGSPEAEAIREFKAVSRY